MNRLSKAEIAVLLNTIELETPVLIQFDEGEWHGIYEGIDLAGCILMRDLQAVNTDQVVSLPGITRILVDRVQSIEERANIDLSDDEEES